MRIALGITLFLLTPFAWTEDANKNSFTIVTFPIPGLHSKKNNEDNAGLKMFQGIFKEIENKIGTKIKTLVLPPIRAHNHFKENKVDAIFPAFEEEIGGNSLRSDCFSKKIDYLFYLKGGPPSKVTAQGKFKLAVVRGYYHPSKTLKRFSKNLITVDSADAGMKMLANQRVDLLLIDNISATSSLLKKDFPKIRYDKSDPVDQTCSYFWTRPGDKGQKFLSYLNNAIKKKDLSRFFLNRFKEKTKELEAKRRHQAPMN